MVVTAIKCDYVGHVADREPIIRKVHQFRWQMRHHVETALYILRAAKPRDIRVKIGDADLQQSKRRANFETTRMYLLATGRVVSDWQLCAMIANRAFYLLG